MVLVIKSVGHHIHRVSFSLFDGKSPFKKDRTSSFQKSTLKSTRGDPLRSRIFPWVISPVGRYLMHFYRLYTLPPPSSEPFLPYSSTIAGVTTRYPLSPLSPCPLFHFPLDSPSPLSLSLPLSLSPSLPSLSLSLYSPTLPSLSYLPIRLFLFSFARFNFSFGSLLLRWNKMKGEPGIHKRMNKRRLKGHKKHVRVHTHNMRLSVRARGQVESGHICAFVSMY